MSRELLLEHLSLVALIVALLSGWAAIRLARKMTFEGVGIEDGGGYTALLLTALMITLAAASVALS